MGTHLLFFSKLSPISPKTGKAKVVDSHGSKKQQPMKGGVPSGATFAVFKASLRAGDVQSAMQQFEALHAMWQGDDSPSSAPHMLLEQLVKLAAQKNATQQLLQLVAKLGLVAKSLDLVLAEGAKQGDATTLKKAEQLGRAQGVKFSAATYQALIKGANSCGAAEDATRFLKEAQEAGLADLATYSAYIRGLLKNGKYQEVQKVMGSMRTAGLQPNIATFNGFVSQGVESDRATRVVLDEMKAFGMKPDQVTCSILMKGITSNSKVANLEAVMAILDDVDGDLDEVLLGSVVEACLRVGRADILMPFLKKQRTSKGFGVKGAHTYGSIIRAYGYVHDIEGAWGAWREMRRHHILPISVTVGCMVEALVTNGDIEAGYELVQELLQSETTAPLVNAIIYGSIVKGFSHKRNFSRVWEVYDEMVRQKLQFSMVTYNTLIDACARSGELNRVPSLLKDIEKQGLKLGIVTYSAILKGYCQSNRLNEAFELLDTMTRTTDLVPDEIMFNTLLDGCARQGLYERGMALFDKMETAGVRPSNFTLSVLVKMANRGRKLERAFDICQDVSSKYSFRLNAHVFANLVQACINHHDLRRAIGVLERMLQDRVKPDARTYSMLLRACIEERKPHDAAGLLRAALGLPGTHIVLGKCSLAAAQPQGGLPGDVVSETLQGLIDHCYQERLAATLFAELGQRGGSLKLDPKLRLRLSSRMSDL
jgi:pentatricopeptide repeat protein